MKKRLTLFVSILLTSIVTNAQYNYMRVTCAEKNPQGLNTFPEEPSMSAYGWTILTGNHSATPVWSPNRNIPFAFNFNGTNFTSYKVSTSGVLTFDVGTVIAAPPVANVALPSALIPDNSICAWGLTGTGASDSIGTGTLGTAPNRQHWIWFNSYTMPGTTSSYAYWAIVLEETTNNIYIVDQRTTPATGLSLTIGVQVNSSTAYQVTGSPNVNSLVTATATLQDDETDNVFYLFNTSIIDYDVQQKTFNLQYPFPYKAYPSGNYRPTGSFINMGDQDITSIKLNYSINGAAPVTSAALPVNIPAGTCYNYSHPTNWFPPAAGRYTIKTWASDINGNADQNQINDTMSARIFFHNATPSNHKLVVEEGTGTWCGWCPRGTVYMDSLAAAYPNSTVSIAVHGGYSSEPMRVAAYDQGMSAIIPGDPHVLVDRAFDGDPSDLFAFYSSHINDFGLADVGVSISYAAATRASTVTATITSAVDIDGDYRLACVYTEDDVTGTGDGTAPNYFDYDQENYYSVAWNQAQVPPQTPPATLIGAGHNWSASGNPVPATAMNYDFVARALQGGFDGQVGTLPTIMTSGGIYTYTFPAYTIPAGYNVAKMKAHILLIDGENKIIMNGNSASFAPLVGISDPVKGHYEVSVYPNPAADQLFVALNFKENEKANLTITDLLGKECIRQDLGTVTSGEHRIPVNISALPAGTYFVSLRTVNGIATTKFVK